MTDEERKLVNLTDYFMRASHAALAQHAHLLSCELVARGLRGDTLGFELARSLRRQQSSPRADPLVRL
jgi:hypothetical protein